MKALIDGDIVLHRCGYASDSDPVGIARARCTETIDLILDRTGADSYEVWLSDTYENNFRKHLDPSYKANRVQPRPVHYEALKEFLYDRWEANLALGMEADDALGIRQTEENDGDEKIYLNSIICSIDKDLLQIPGRHYNFVRDEFSEISPIEGQRQFYRQLLIGDSTDNIRGVDKIGRVRAGRLIDPLDRVEDMFDCVRSAYMDDDRLLLNGRLLYIRKVDNEIWNFPTRLEAVETPLFSSQTVEESTRLLGHTMMETKLGCLQRGQVEDGTSTEKSQG